MRTFTRLTSFLSLLALGFLTSCPKDNTIPAGTDVRTSLTGSWLVNEQWTKNTYVVTITKDTSATGILISNFGAAGTSIKAIAYLSGTTLNLNNNELLANGWIVNGSGTLSGLAKIIWTYTINTGANQFDAQATYLKQ